MANSARYSLWIVPEDGDVQAALQAVIDRLAREQGGPSFPPHVTLFGSLEGAEDEVVGASRALASRITPFTIYLDDVGTGETYFQSLFATVRPTPELLAAREAAQHAFPGVPAMPYLPHLSLIYGHPDPETKRATVEALRGTLPPSFEASTLVVNQTGGAVADWRDALRTRLTG